MSDVVIDARHLAQPLSGMGRYTAELVRRLILDQSRGWTILAPRPVPPALRAELSGSHPNVRWVVGAASRGGLAGGAEGWVQRMARHELRSRPDAVFLGLGHSVPLLGPRRARTILLVADVAALTTPHRTRPRELLRAWAVLLPSLLLADRILTVTARAERQLHRWLPPTRGRTRVLPVGGTYIGPSPSPRRYDDRRGFLMVGGGARRPQAFGALLDAYELLAPDIRALHALVVVNRTVPELLRRRGDVIARVDVPDDELIQHYRQSLALIYVATHDGLALPVAEALSAGLPVILVGRTALEAVVGDSGGGIVLPRARPAAIADAMRRLASDRAEWQRRAEAALMIGQTIGWDGVAAAVREELALHDER